MTKLDKIMEPLSLEERREVLAHANRVWRQPLSGAERTRRWRDAGVTEKRDASVTEPVTPERDASVTPKRHTSRDARVTKPVTAKRDAGVTTPSSSFLEFFSEQFERAFNEKPSINYAKDRTISKRLLEQYGEEKLRGLALDFFASDDEFIRKSGHTIGVFSSVINKLLVAKKNGGGASFSERLWAEAQREKRGDA